MKVKIFLSGLWWLKDCDCGSTDFDYYFKYRGKIIDKTPAIILPWIYFQCKKCNHISTEKKAICEVI